MARKRYLEIGIKANTKPFSKKMSSLSASLKSTIKKLTAFGAVAGGAAAAGLAVITKRSMESLDKLGKLSDNIQISTEKLRTYQQASTLSGTSQETLNKALQRLTRNVGEARMGIGESVRGFKMLGISAQELSNMSIDQIFERVADEIKKQPDAATRAAAAYSIFGRQGQDLINMLAGGSEGLNRMSEDLKKLGVLVDRNAAAKVEQANDALANLKLIFEGIGNQIAVHLSPYLTAFSERLLENAKDGDGVGKSVTNAFKWITQSIGWCGDQLNLFLAGWHTFSAGVSTAVGAVDYGIQWIGKQIQVGSLYLDKWRANFRALASDIKISMADALDSIAPVLETFSTAYDYYFGEGLSTDNKFDTKRMRRQANVGKKSALMESGLLGKEIDKLQARKITSDFLETGADEWEKAKARYNDFMNSTASKSVDNWFEEIQRAADEKAKETVADRQKEKIDAAVSEMDSAITRAVARGPGQFRTIDLSRVSIPGLNVGRDVQKVSDPQLKKTNALLEKIAGNSSSNSGFVAVTV